MIRRITLSAFLLLISVTLGYAQKAEVAVRLNEAFFDALLDSIYQNFEPPQFSISAKDSPGATPADRGPASRSCDESIKILREANGVRTAVRFRNEKIFVPLAFSGNYSAPLVGCLEFGGWAEANLDLEFDRENQRLVGRIRVLNVALNGTGGIGGTVIARMLQSSIDRKLNPVQILKLDNVSFDVPIRNEGRLRMKAVSLKPEILSGVMNIRVGYDFVKN